MKSKTDLMNFIRIICDFYNSYREYLEYDHEQARHKIENMYDDFYEWLYYDELNEVKR